MSRKNNSKKKVTKKVTEKKQENSSKKKEVIDLSKKITLALSIILVILIVIFFSIRENNSKFDEVVNSDNVSYLVKTNLGNFEIELDRKNAPITVENFENYANRGYYSGVIFHRVIDGFMIQTGGFDENMKQKPTNNPIKIESNNGLKNNKYTIAMARTMDPNSATSQFFINTKNNDFLNYGVRDAGYAVFGRVTNGFDVIDKIEKVQTKTIGPYQNVPEKNIVITEITKK